MSDPLPVSDNADAALPKCSCEDCTGTLSFEPLPTSTTSTQTKMKQYIAPKADANIFESQEAFLQSLFPVAIKEVDVDKRKCPICWKPFGEKADAGYDNSEQPVKLRCGHAFGNKCLAHTFAVPKPMTVDLQPLSLRPRSNGLTLGQKLHLFAKDNSRNSEDDTDMFIKMLEGSRQASAGCQRSGNYWWRIIYWLLESEWDVVDINFFENAVILDHKPRTSDKKSPYTTPFSASASVSLHSMFPAPEAGVSSSFSSPSIDSALLPTELSQPQGMSSELEVYAASTLIQPSPALPKISSLPDMSKANGSHITMYEPNKLAWYEIKMKKETESQYLRSSFVRLLAQKLAAIRNKYQTLYDSSEKHEVHRNINHPQLIL